MRTEQSNKTLVLAAEHAVAAADDAKRQAAAARFRDRPKGSGEDRFNGVCLAVLAGHVHVAGLAAGCDRGPRKELFCR